MRLIALLVILLTGCYHPAPPATQPTTRPTSLAWSRNISIAAKAWLPDAEARWGRGRVFIFISHGLDTPAGRWVCHSDDGYYYDMETVARVLSDTHPDGIVLLIVCNEHQHTLHVPRRNVWYPVGTVWSMPHILFSGDGVDTLDGFRN